MKTKSIFSIALMGLIFLVAYPPPQAAARMVIKGKVVDAGTLAPIPGTFVEIENASGGSGYSRAYTDEKGEFAFQDLPAGVSFNLYAEQVGFTSFRRLYWYVEKNKEIESIVLRLNKEGVFQCRITESDKTTPVKRARVFMKPMQWRGDPYAVYEFERETGDNGIVRFDKIPAGSYELVIEKSGFVRERLTNIRFMTGKTRSMDIALHLVRNPHYRTRSQCQHFHQQFQRHLRPEGPETGNLCIYREQVRIQTLHIQRSDYDNGRGRHSACGSSPDRRTGKGPNRHLPGSLSPQKGDQVHGAGLQERGLQAGVLQSSYLMVPQKPPRFPGPAAERIQPEAL